MASRQTKQSNTKLILEKIDEVAESDEEVMQAIHSEIQNVNNASNMQDELHLPPGQEVMDVDYVMDVTDMSTQRIPGASQAAITEPPLKRRLGIDHVSYRLSQPLAIDASNTESNEERIINVDNRQRDADTQEQGTPVENEAHQVTEKDRGSGSDTSETPLGSLDRIEVFLGDSEKITDSERFLREEWGPQGTMYKIYDCIKEGVKPLDLHYLVSRGPTMAGHQRITATCCFTSILKLKQNGFITVSKDPETNEIKDISLGSKILLHN